MSLDRWFGDTPSGADCEKQGWQHEGPKDPAVEGPEFKEFNTSLHHHQMPNFAAILPDYSNREQEYIRHI